MRVRKKPILLEAAVATTDGEIVTLEGTHTYKIGDVIMTGTRGEKWPVRRDIFAETYEIVSTEGHHAEPDGLFGDGWVCVRCGAKNAVDAFERGLDPCPGDRS